MRSTFSSAQPRAAAAPLAPIEIRCDHPQVPLGRDNIAYRAAALLMQKTKINRPVCIRIRKNIPVGAGLGGGSTDAAAVLVGLNRMLKLRLSVRQLERLALQLGADVPFFIRAKPARARGIGEKLTLAAEAAAPLAGTGLPGISGLDCMGVSEICSVKLTKDSVNTSIATPLESLDTLEKLLVNDLEAVTIKRYPEIGRVKTKAVSGRCRGGFDVGKRLVGIWHFQFETSG